MAFLSPDLELWSEIAGVAADEGLEVYDIERIPGGLRIFVDIAPLRSTESDRFESQIGVEGHVAEKSPEPAQEGEPGGVTLTQCAHLSRRLMSVFMVHGERLGVSSGPELEVSSPGLDRHLRLPWHYARAVGKKVRVQFISRQSKDADVVALGQEFSSSGAKDPGVVVEEARPAKQKNRKASKQRALPAKKDPGLKQGNYGAEGKRTVVGKLLGMTVLSGSIGLSGSVGAGDDSAQQVSQEDRNIGAETASLGNSGIAGRSLSILDDEAKSEVVVMLADVNKARVEYTF